MTRGVRWDTDQRVDLPDVLALQDLRLQDLRRTHRHLFLGKVADATRVIRGFSVEPEGPPSTRVVVTMDLGASGHASFMGAEARGGGKFERGALGGGKDANDNLEGPATFTLDFAGEPNAVYEVKVRLALNQNPGITDNRAFWNPALNIEQIRVTDTRFVPHWEIAYQGHADPDWVLLAEVNWTGGTISASDITDKRDLALEGEPNATLTVADKWTHADQTETTGVGDFDRSDDRGDPDIGMSGVWEMLRGLARQIQDIKGAREGDQRFDWYSRVHAPPAFRTGAVPKADEITKSLRTMDVITFTVADGLTEQGDFNGLTGFNDCLQFIEDNAAALPEKISIIIKDRNDTAGSSVQALAGTKTIANKFIHIEARQAGLPTLSGLTPTFQAPEDTAFVAVTTPLPNAALTMTGIGGLSLKNITLTSLAGPNLFFLDIDPRSYFQAENCQFTAFQAPNETQPQIRCGHDRLLLDRCYVKGAAFIGGRSAQPSGTDFDNYHFSGVVRNSLFEGLVRLRHDLTLPDVATGVMAFAHGVRFEGTTFRADTSGVAYSTGQVDMRGCRSLKFDGCHFAYWGDQSCVVLGDFLVDTSYVGSRDITFRDNLFKLSFPATHEYNAGVGGALGTGWAILCGAFNPIVNPEEHIPHGIRIENNRFSCDRIPFLTTYSSSDAGCVRVYDSRNVWIDKNEVREWATPNPALVSSGKQVLFDVIASFGGAGQGGGQQTWIRGNFIGDWFSPAAGDAWGNATSTLCVLRTALANGVFVEDNYITALGYDGTNSIRPNANGYYIVEVGDSISVHFRNNTYWGWRTSTPEFESTTVGLLGLFVTDITFDEDTFLLCGGANLQCGAGVALADIGIHDVRFLVGQTRTNFSNAVDFSGASSAVQVHWKNNYWDWLGSFPVKVAVNTGPVTFGSFFGNHFDDGEVHHATLGGAPSASFHGYANGAIGVGAPDGFNYLGDGAYT